jgi:hypothetical protein
MRALLGDLAAAGLNRRRDRAGVFDGLSRSGHVLAGHLCRKAGGLPCTREEPGGWAGDAVAASGFDCCFGDEVRCRLVDDGCAEEQGWVADAELAERLLGAAGHRGGEGRFSGRLLALLAGRLLPGWGLSS